MNGNPLCACSGKRLHTAAGRHAPLSYYSRPGTMTLDFGKHMGRQKNSRSLSVPFMQDFKKFPLDQRIQSAGRLIQNQKPRIMLQCTDDSRLFSVSQGKLITKPRRIQPETLAKLRRFLSAVHPAQTGRKFQKLPYAHPWIKGRFGRKVSHLFKNFPFIFYRIHTINLCAAAALIYQSQQSSYGRTFARAVGTDKPKKFPLLHVQI